jgi:hypothetical protein
MTLQECGNHRIVVTLLAPLASLDRSPQVEPSYVVLRTLAGSLAPLAGGTAMFQALRTLAATMATAAGLLPACSETVQSGKRRRCWFPLRGQLRRSYVRSDAEARRIGRNDALPWRDADRRDGKRHEYEGTTSDAAMAGGRNRQQHDHTITRKSAGDFAGFIEGDVHIQR